MVYPGLKIPGPERDVPVRFRSRAPGGISGRSLGYARDLGARLRRRANASTRYGGRGEAGLTPFQCIQPMPQIAFTRKTRERAITVPLAIPDSLYLLKA